MAFGSQCVEVEWTRDQSVHDAAADVVVLIVYLSLRRRPGRLQQSLVHLASAFGWRRLISGFCDRGALIA